jgi:cystathionine gamma-lyase
MLERNLATMDGAKYSIAYGGGMQSIVTMLNTLKRGDHVLCVDDVYGGTQRFLRVILGPNSEVDVDFIDFNRFSDFKKALKPTTKIVWAETPTNPTLKCYDIKRIADHLKTLGKNKPRFVVDNTFMSSVWQQPLALGADVVMHSASKSIGGHSDVIAGCLQMNDADLYEELMQITKTMGTGISPFAAWLCLRGTKTLELRVRKSTENAGKIAKFLEAHPKIEKVYYPGLKSHPQHAICKK